MCLCLQHFLVSHIPISRSKRTVRRLETFGSTAKHGCGSTATALFDMLKLTNQVPLKQGESTEGACMFGSPPPTITDTKSISVMHNHLILYGIP